MHILLSARMPACDMRPSVHSQVEVLNVETNRNRDYTVKIKWAANVDIQVLLAFVQ